MNEKWKGREKLPTLDRALGRQTRKVSGLQGLGAGAAALRARRGLHPRTQVHTEVEIHHQYPDTSLETSKSSRRPHPITLKTRRVLI